jgi:hypothetical protein
MVCWGYSQWSDTGYAGFDWSEPLRSRKLELDGAWSGNRVYLGLKRLTRSYSIIDFTSHRSKLSGAYQSSQVSAHSRHNTNAYETRHLAACMQQEPRECMAFCLRIRLYPYPPFLGDFRAFEYESRVSWSTILMFRQTVTMALIGVTNTHEKQILVYKVLDQFAYFSWYSHPHHPPSAPPPPSFIYSQDPVRSLSKCALL